MLSVIFCPGVVYTTGINAVWVLFDEKMVFTQSLKGKLAFLNFLYFHKHQAQSCICNVVLKR